MMLIIGPSTRKWLTDHPDFMKRNFKFVINVIRLQTWFLMKFGGRV